MESEIRISKWCCKDDVTSKHVWSLSCWVACDIQGVGVTTAKKEKQLRWQVNPLTRPHPVDSCSTLQSYWKLHGAARYQWSVVWMDTPRRKKKQSNFTKMDPTWASWLIGLLPSQGIWFDYRSPIETWHGTQKAAISNFVFQHENPLANTFFQLPY